MRCAIRSLGILGVESGTDRDQLVPAARTPAPLRLEHYVLSLELLHLHFQTLDLLQRLH